MQFLVWEQRILGVVFTQWVFFNNDTVVLGFNDDCKFCTGLVFCTLLWLMTLVHPSQNENTLGRKCENDFQWMRDYRQSELTNQKQKKEQKAHFLLSVCLFWEFWWYNWYFWYSTVQYNVFSWCIVQRFRTKMIMCLYVMMKWVVGWIILNKNATFRQMQYHLQWDLYNEIYNENITVIHRVFKNTTEHFK